MKVRTVPIGRLNSVFPRLGVSSYQRAVVWKPRQKASLIRSILDSYPTGALILNKLDRRGGLRRGGPFVPGTSHDIIDGQQRLTTIFEFFDEPSSYFLKWCPKSPRAGVPPEHALLRDVRTEFEALRKILAKPSENYVPARTRTAALKERICRDAEAYRLEISRGRSLPDARFYGFVSALGRVHGKVASKRIIIQELTNLNTAEAESIYHLVNTSGTQLTWWQLLWSKPDFVEKQYPSAGPYRTGRDDIVRRLSNLYRQGNKLKIFAGTNDAFWHAMLALGEYVQQRFALWNPQNSTAPIAANKSRIGIDGLGFRLVSTALSHDIGRAGIYSLFDHYSDDQVRFAIDVIFDTVDLLLDNPTATSPDFLLLQKYARIELDAIPAYPLAGLLVSASKLVAQNRARGAGSTLSATDRRALRVLTEELFREVICTSQWAGTGDARLKEWLGAHFEPAPAGYNHSAGLGNPRSLNPSVKPAAWRNRLDELRPLDQRQVDRGSTALLFWVQYLFDSRVHGSLPTGEVEVDHIVPYHRSARSLTTHPLNFAIVERDLNRSKGLKTFIRWNPDPAEAQAYRREALCGIRYPRLPSSVTSDFLSTADHSHIRQLIDVRHKVFIYALGELLSDWISNGDS